MPARFQQEPDPFLRSQRPENPRLVIFNLPIGAYQVSGEYAMIKFAAQAGAIDEEKVVLESLGAIKRAGADLIFSYFALDLAEKKILR